MLILFTLDPVIGTSHLRTNAFNRSNEARLSSVQFLETPSVGSSHLSMSNIIAKVPQALLLSGFPLIREDISYLGLLLGFPCLLILRSVENVLSLNLHMQNVIADNLA